MQLDYFGCCFVLCGPAKNQENRACQANCTPSARPQKMAMRSRLWCCKTARFEASPWATLLRSYLLGLSACASSTKFERLWHHAARFECKSYKPEFFGSALFSDVLVLTRSPFLGVATWGQYYAPTKESVALMHNRRVVRQTTERNRASGWLLPFVPLGQKVLADPINTWRPTAHQCAFPVKFIPIACHQA